MRKTQGNNNRSRVLRETSRIDLDKVHFENNLVNQLKR